MSETSKFAEATKKTQDQGARAGYAAVDTASKNAKDTINETSQAAQNATDRAKEAAHGMTDTVTEAAQATANMSSKAAEQSREVMMMGARAAAGVSSRVADINFGRGRHMMSSAAHATDIYREASERSAERVQALFSSAMSLGRGMQQMQHTWLEMLDHSLENATHKPQDLLRCKNIVELAEVQRDLYLDAINHMFESTTRLLDMAGRTAQEAARPLQH